MNEKRTDEVSIFPTDNVVGVSRRLSIEELIVTGTVVKEAASFPARSSVNSPVIDVAVS